MSLFFLVAFKILFLSFNHVIIMFLVWVSLGLSSLEFSALFGFAESHLPSSLGDTHLPSKLGSFWSFFSSGNFSAPFSLSFPSGSLIMHTLFVWWCPRSPLGSVIFLYSFFFLLLRLNYFNFSVFKFADFFLCFACSNLLLSSCCIFYLFLFFSAPHLFFGSF